MQSYIIVHYEMVIYLIKSPQFYVEIQKLRSFQNQGGNVAQDHKSALEASLSLQSIM